MTAVQGSFFRRAAGSALVRASGVVLTVLSTVVLGRLLGAGEYGAYAYAFSWATVLAIIAVAGTDVLAVREVAKNKADNDPEKLKGVVFWSARLVLLIC